MEVLNCVGRGIFVFLSGMRDGLELTVSCVLVICKMGMLVEGGGAWVEGMERVGLRCRWRLWKSLGEVRNS